MTNQAWISLGSNLGDRRAILDAAVAALDRVPDVVVKLVSSYHETLPVGGPPGQGPFLNAAAELETTLDPHDLLKVLQQVENRAGRVRGEHWAERTLDLDLLYLGTRTASSPHLKLPHRRLALRRFVLAPLAEIAPTFVDPVLKRTVADLLANLDRKPRLLAIEGPRSPLKAAVFNRLVEQLPGFGISEAALEVSDQIDVNRWSPTLAESLERKSEALKARSWQAETLRVPWIVADYFLDADLLRSLSLFANPQDRPASWTPPSNEVLTAWNRRTAELLSVALPPTFVLIAPSVFVVHLWFGRPQPPILHACSDDPDAIVAEVLATCRGIEGA